MFTMSLPTVCTIVAQPTEQYGQTLGVALASLIRRACARAVAAVSGSPSAASEPIAVPTPPAADMRRKSRRETEMYRSISLKFVDFSEGR